MDKPSIKRLTIMIQSVILLMFLLCSNSNCFLVSSSRLNGRTTITKMRLQIEKFTFKYDNVRQPFMSSSQITSSNKFFDKTTLVTVKESLSNEIKRETTLSKFVGWMLKSIVTRRSKFVSGLTISVKSRSNFDILRGRLDEVELSFDKICYGQLIVTGGGKLTIEGLDIKMRRFLFMNPHSNELPVVQRSYTLFGDFMLTQSDVVNSKFILHLIQLLVNTILVNVMTTNRPDLIRISIRKVTIISRKLVVLGEAIIGNNSLSKALFEVSTSAGIRGDGQIIYLKDIQVCLNPDSPLKTSMPIPLTQTIDVDIGDDCRILSLVIGDKHIWLRAKANISPVQPFAVAPINKNALYRYDIGAVLSNILRMSGGLATRLLGFNNNSR